MAKHADIVQNMVIKIEQRLELAPAEDAGNPLSVWEEGCVWRKAGIDGLASVSRDWRVAFQSAHISGQRAAVLADLAVAPIPRSSLGGDIMEAPARYRLPILPEYALGMIVAPDPTPAVKAAADHLRAGYELQ